MTVPASAFRLTDALAPLSSHVSISRVPPPPAGVMGGSPHGGVRWPPLLPKSPSSNHYVIRNAHVPQACVEGAPLAEMVNAIDRDSVRGRGRRGRGRAGGIEKTTDAYLPSIHIPTGPGGHPLLWTMAIPL